MATTAVDVSTGALESGKGLFSPASINGDCPHSSIFVPILHVRRQSPQGKASIEVKAGEAVPRMLSKVR